MPETSTLTDDRRKQLDDIVTKLDTAGASAEEVQAIVADFKNKYSAPQSPIGAITPPESHFGINMDLNEFKNQVINRSSRFLFGPSQGEPGYSPSTSAGDMLGAISTGAPELIGASTLERLRNAPLLSAFKHLIPSTENAGAKLEQIREAAKDVPIRLDDAYTTIQRAKELSNAGHGPLSSGMANLEKAMQPTDVPLAEGLNAKINPTPITYPTGFDFASAAKQLAGSERVAQTDTMASQVKKFATALQTANREAAAKVGMGELFDEAMNEYRQAKTIEERTRVVAKYGSIAAATAALGAVGYKALNFVKEVINPK